MFAFVANRHFSRRTSIDVPEQCNLMVTCAFFDVRKRNDGAASENGLTISCTKVMYCTCSVRLEVKSQFIYNVYAVPSPKPPMHCERYQKRNVSTKRPKLVGL